jgi:mannonate dehydratase
MSNKQRQKTDENYPLIIPGYFASQPGIQIGTQLPPTATAEDMQFARQLGIEWVMTSLPARDASLETYRSVVRHFAEHGLKVYRLANHSVHNMEEVTLNLPGRDAKIAEYLAYIRALGQAGIHYATYAHMANGIWSTEREPVRGGAIGRAFRLDRARTGWWIDKTWDAPLTHGRPYSEDELWENYTCFIRQVVPVAEEAGVYIGIHPDDPPVYPLGGVPRCIFGNFEGYRRAIEIADSPNVGVCLCLGCWLEGGPAMGKSAVETIRYFGGQRKLFKVHFRNVTAPMPEGFVETFLDDGYGDMLAIMRALREVEYNGAIISDHLQEMVGGHRAAEAYAVGYMRALIHTVHFPVQAANAG